MADRYDNRYPGEEAERRRRMDEARYGRDWDRYARGDTDRNWDYRASERDREDRADGEDRGVYGRDWDYGHRMGFDYGRGPRGWGGERSGSGERFERDNTSPAYDYGRTNASRDWNEPAYYRSSYTALGPHTYRATARHPHEQDTTRPAQGWFSGRGPRGYQRSDDRIREDVCDRLCEDPWVDASEIDVTVRSGEVTLAGNVRERADKRRVEDVIENVSGVREVHNNLHVGANREPTAAAGATAAGTTTRR